MGELENSTERRVNRPLAAKATATILAAIGVGVGISHFIPNRPSSNRAEVATGVAKCADGMPIEGVWVSAGSSSGWANTIRTTSSIETYVRDLGQVGSYTVHVGCGGSTENWAMADYATSDAAANMPAGFLCEPTPTSLGVAEDRGICEQVGVTVLNAAG